MRATAHRELNINLVPTKSSSSASGFIAKSLSYLHFSLVSLNILLLLAIFFYAKMVFDFNATYQKIKVGLSEIKAGQKLEGGVNDLASRLKFIEELRREPSLNIELINSLTYLIPPEITLNNLSIENNKLSVSGSMLDIFSLRTLGSSLKKRPELKDFSLTQITVPSSRSPYYTFAATMEVVTQNRESAK